MDMSRPRRPIEMDIGHGCTHKGSAARPPPPASTRPPRRTREAGYFPAALTHSVKSLLWRRTSTKPGRVSNILNGLPM